MIIRGAYRDVLISEGHASEDRGWRSNRIVREYGEFLAALMKGDFFSSIVGIEYMAVGSGGTNDEDVFRGRIAEFFTAVADGTAPANQEYYPPGSSDWVWAKKISDTDIKFINDAGNEVTDPTEKLKLAVTFQGGVVSEPSSSTLVFREFALLGIEGTDATTMFLINYVNHGEITKDSTMILERTVRLTFPIA